jgi:hypothetical protein
MVARLLSWPLPWTLGHCDPRLWGLGRGLSFREARVTAASSDSKDVHHVSTNSSEEIVNFLLDDIHTTNLHGNRLEAEEIRMLYLIKNKHATLHSIVDCLFIVESERIDSIHQSPSGRNR